ncbi:SMP-30/gluconolactonase/LRE family protein [Halococcus agarilyticus]|uniref:SMP-30/gluconolactonase/LRE family protein n=1 Tax=Halococcus agarilyticus TaxID=1232219 RepID=UPI0009ACA9F0|nr:SMP-30/gluconolactonase/LRE family protein [Halococcus agarilyticus]
MSPECVLDIRCEVGEGPLWHPGENVIYFVDIPQGHLHRYDATANDHERVREGSRIGGFTIQKDGSLLLFEDCGMVTVWNKGEESTILTEIPEEADSRFNDVVADSRGRVYAGTLPPNGRLYRFETDGRFRSLIENVDISNGLEFIPDQNGIYYTETKAQTIWQFDYNPESGDLVNRQPFASTIGTPGNPDGLTVDAEGYVWSARWNGGCVVRHHPENGSIVNRVDFPARKVSAITFGGSNYSDAYVTTALAGNDRDIEGKGAGGLFRFSPDVGGTPPLRSAIGLERDV